MKYLLLLSAAIIPALLWTNSTRAATATGSFTSQITITAECTVQSTNTLDFGSHGLLTSDVDATATFTILCTDGTSYNIGLNGGTTAGGTTTTRLMDNAGTTVSYKMFSDAGRTVNWGDTVGTDTVSGTGNGTDQTLTIYGRVPAQSTPAANTYTDTITVTITY